MGEIWRDIPEFCRIDKAVPICIKKTEQHRISLVDRNGGAQGNQAASEVAETHAFAVMAEGTEEADDGFLVGELGFRLGLARQERDTREISGRSREICTSFVHISGASDASRDWKSERERTAESPPASTDLSP